MFSNIPTSLLSGTWRWALSALSGLVLLAGCGGSVGGGGGVGPAVCAGSGTGVAGGVLYQDRQYNRNGFIDRPMKPVRFATVELWQKDGVRPVATSRTNASGNFCITTSQDISQGFVRVRAEALVDGQVLTVIDNQPMVYYLDTDLGSIESGAVNPIPTIQIVETSPWKVGGYVLGAQGGAWNILDVMTSATRFVNRSWGQEDLGDISAQWMADVDGGTHYHPGQNRIHISGLNAGDSNEYDDDIILHEFGHHVMHTISRDTSPGGQHYINGYTYDVRLAFSEGFASFFSALLRDLEPGEYSNRSSERASMVDAFSLTEGGTAALRFAYELSTPQAYVPDKFTYTDQPAPVDANKFSKLVKRSTSEVSVAAALWDIYAGTSTFPGVGKDGILDLLLAIPGRYPDGQIGFSQFWEVLRNSNRFTTQQLDEVRLHLNQDRKMALAHDTWGVDDTVAGVLELETTDLTGYNHHLFGGLALYETQIESGHSLLPASEAVPDVDVFILEVAGQTSEFEITTTNLNNGTDTYMELLAADGTTVLASNDNYIPYVLFLGILKSGDPELISFSEYLGSCAIDPVQWPWGIWSEAQQRFIHPNICPPNAANPMPVGLEVFEEAEYLASQITAQLASDTTYYIRVSSSPTRPPSSSPYGGYDLMVTRTSDILP